MIHAYGIVQGFAPESATMLLALNYFVAYLTPFGACALAAGYDEQTLWHYWKKIVFASVIALLSSLIIRGGLSASLGSVGYLFDIYISNKRYATLGVVSSLVIGVSILLHYVSVIDANHHYDRFLRFFGVYVFLPLAIIYGAIVASYGISIAWKGVWPWRWLVSAMVLGYVARGWLAYLLTYPLETSSPWKLYAQRAYWISIICFAGLLYGALQVRISAYGMTEPRYLGMMMVIWIGIVGVWSLRKPWQSLSLIISVSIGLALWAAYSPWNMRKTTLTSQVYELDQLLKTQGNRDGKDFESYHHRQADLSETDEELYWLILDKGNYLGRHFGTGVFETYYGLNTKNTLWEQDDDYPRNQGMILLRALGLQGEFERYYRPESDSGSSQISIYQELSNLSLDISEYNKLYFVTSYTDHSETITLSWSDQHLITIEQGDVQLTIDLYEVLQDVQNNQSTYKRETSEYLIVPSSIVGHKHGDKIVLDHYDILIALP